MTDEQIWLLKYGRGWVPWYEMVDDPLSGHELDPLYTRLMEVGKMEMETQFDRNTMRIRLKEKNE